MRRLAPLFIAAACAGSTGTVRSTGTCPLFARAGLKAPAPLGELGGAKPYRNYLAVTNVGPFAQHFTVYYDDVEPAFERVRARFDEQGQVVIEREGGMGGGIPVPPHPWPGFPATVAPLASALEQAVKRGCDRAENISVRYDGEYRIIDVEQFIAHDLVAGTKRNGWIGRRELRADASLSRVVGTGDQMTGYGWIEAPSTAHWIELDTQESAARTLVDASGPAATRVLTAARALEAHQPGPALAALPVADPDALLPHGYAARVVLRVALQGRRAQGSLGGETAIPLDVHDAVFGRAHGEATATVGDVHYKLAATLVPDATRAAEAQRQRTTYQGVLALHVEDDRGHVFDRTYPARGPLDLEGDAAVAPAGFDLQGASSPSREHDLLHTTFPGRGDVRSFDLDVQVSMFDDPRRTIAR